MINDVLSTMYDEGDKYLCSMVAVWVGLNQHNCIIASEGGCEE